MLRLITGGAKTGKSTRVREEILAMAEREETAEGSLIFLTPEQFSYEMERAFFTLLGLQKAERVRVLSFRRLTDELFREYGGVAGDAATDTARLIAMKLALQECREELRVYAPFCRRPDFSGQMVEAISELKRAAVSLEDLETAVKKTEGFLRDKLSDLLVIRRTYEPILARHWTDEEDDLSRALELIRENQWFAGRQVWLDGFKSFTAIQEQMIGEMLAQGAEVTAAFSLEEGDSRFSVTESTVRRLRAMAHRLGVRTASAERMSRSGAYENPEIAWFAGQALKNAPRPFPGKNEAVSCCALVNEFDEAAFAAAEILQLSREKGYAFSDMAVLVRDMERYAPLLEAAFDRYGVPFYMDRAESIASMPLVRFLQHAAAALASGFERTELLAFLKCGLMDVTLEEADAFENYTYVWNIDRKKFFSAFSQNPSGYAEREMTRREEAELARAEKVRQLCCDALTAFSRNAGEEGWPRAAYRFLEELKIPERTAEEILFWRQKGEQQTAGDLERTWTAVMELLGTMDVMLAGQHLSEGEFRDLFSICARGYELGRIPQTLDSVQVGSAERVRMTGKKAVFILGANEGEFPFIPSSGGVFSDPERAELARLGLELSGTQEEQILEERFVAWQAVSCPSERLVITYSRGDISGKARYPSALVSSFHAVFPESRVRKQEEFPPDFFCRSRRTAFLQYVRHFSEEDGFSAAVREVLLEEGWGGKIERMEKTLARERLALEDSALAKRLFGGNLNISPTQIEKFYSCRFQYFCRYGLHLRSRSRAELNPLSRGTVLHFLLEKVLSGEYGDFREMQQEELETLLCNLLQQYLENVMGGEEEKSRQFLYYYRRLSRIALRIFQSLREEFRQTRFVVAGLEVPVEEGGDILPLTIPMEDGTTIAVSGKIDRVDLFREGEDCYARIVDYKSGGKEFRIDTVASGLNLQMLLYLFALWKNGRGEYQNVHPAGILYMPAGSVKPALPREAGAEDQAKAVEEAYAMNGLLLDDRTVLCAMEPDLSGRFLPVSLGKNGWKGKYLASEKDFARLEEYTEGLIRSMADSLLRGEITPDPYADGAFTPCAYCDYRAVCGREMREGFRSIPKMTLADIAQACEKEEKAE